MKKQFFYLIQLEYLGFRYHGWQKQKDVKTVQLMLDKTLRYILDEHIEFKTLASGRTDTMVSALDCKVELFSSHEIDPKQLFEQLNWHLPADIRILDINIVSQDFEIMSPSRLKAYSYFFCFGERPHPFMAPLMTYIREELDIESMKQAARLYEGEHYFGHYIYQPNDQKKLTRKITSSFIEENHDFHGSFFPKNSYVFKVSAPGFGRYQVRYMIGMLFELGMGKIDIHQFQDTLVESSNSNSSFLAPASGLILTKTDI